MKKKEKREVLGFFVAEAGSIGEVNSLIEAHGHRGYIPLKVESHFSEFFCSYLILFGDPHFVAFKNQYGLD